MEAETQIHFLSTECKSKTTQLAARLSRELLTAASFCRILDREKALESFDALL